MAKGKNTASSAQQLATASVLAFERKLDPSDGILSSGNWEARRKAEAWPFIPVREKSIRGTISNRLSTKEADPAKLDASIQSPNLQRVDVATLPYESDTLRMQFTLRVLGGAGVPCACNDSDYQSKLLNVVAAYRESPGFSVLAKRYAANLANGRFLWRNRLGAEAIEVTVERVQDGASVKTWTFDALGMDLREFLVNDKVDDLGALIARGLEGQEKVLLRVTAHARIGAGQEVFPSQELILDRGDKKGQKSKTLYSVKEAAAIHSQKIGNAIRTVDTWYPECADLGPIAVEPYGSVTSQGKAYRQPSQKIDFYSLLDAWVLRDKALEPNQQHFVMANLIRGGVFGESEKE